LQGQDGTGNNPPINHIQRIFSGEKSSVSIVRQKKMVFIAIYIGIHKHTLKAHPGDKVE
jgi:hypothetical protein